MNLKDVFKTLEKITALLIKKILLNDLFKQDYFFS
ncbi:hypothetical protein SA2200_08310 [Aggregatibacter actinomycetemcomitans serotype d str. SA2200]|nr:hypothetical protein SA2876_02480 [Aggregatibacter actinomycetemcomitans serotype e str. SA2876]KYK85920.1 hypothetical protein SA2200_08310 [Aggregatibacter actinomycetemcomitans serotype d str. SA2200]KYK87576.1 hypothetical protein SC29R_05945 [Aggregatibacter actinomycetemcomitans serotype f str. SC29R]KYK92335.1 hypothetical protein SA269_07290 [Aggregatibacter actinomycetemcomitans serotype d str. SA269]KYK93245.1 hypothetical protein SA3733_07755 [Aggregatibacter actinomycetemcomitans